MRRSILHARHLRTAPDPTGGTLTGGGGGGAPVIPPGAKIATSQAPAAEPASVPEHPVPGIDFPVDTPVRKMTPEQRDAYDRHKEEQNRRWREVTGNLTPDELDANLKELDKLRKERMTDAERALTEAREQARLEGENIGADRYLPTAVRGEIRGSNPNLTADQVDALMQVIDPHKLLNDKGDIDTSKIAAAVAGLAPQQQTPQLQLHQGGRRPSSGATGRDRGLAEAERRGYIKQNA